MASRCAITMVVRSCINCASAAAISVSLSASSDEVASSSKRSGASRKIARAISVVQYLMAKGVPPQRLVAAGFGEFQPIDPGTTEEAHSRNRRIELKLTER